MKKLKRKLKRLKRRLADLQLTSEYWRRRWSEDLDKCWEAVGPGLSGTYLPDVIRALREERDGMVAERASGGEG
jgi:hypothetical protein